MSDRNLGNALTLLQTFIKEAQKSEQMAKRATDPSEPTSHPVMSACDGTQPAHQGAKGTELTSDVKKDYGESGIAGQEDANSAPGNSEKQIGEMKPLASDQMGGNVKAPKATKDKPPGTGPGDHTFSEKYSELATVGNRLLGSLSTLIQTQQKEAAMPPQLAAALAKKKGGGKEESDAHEKGESAAHEAAEEKKGAAEVELQEKLAAADKFPDDAAAGYMAAQSIVEEMNQTQILQKQAAEQFDGIIKAAHDDAELFASFVTGVKTGEAQAEEARAQVKQAEPGIGPDAGAPSPDGADAGMGAADSSGDPGGLPPELASQLAGGDDAGPGDGGGGGDEAIIEQLAEALDQAGVTPEELAAALAHEQAGGEGDAGPGGIPDVKSAADKSAAARMKMARALKSLVA